MAGHIDLIMRWLKSPPSAGRDIFGIPKQPMVRNEMIILPRSTPPSASPPRHRDIVVVVLSVVAVAAAALCDSDNIPSINHFTRAHDRDISGMLFFFFVSPVLLFIFICLFPCVRPGNRKLPAATRFAVIRYATVKKSSLGDGRKTEKNNKATPTPSNSPRGYIIIVIT